MTKRVNKRIKKLMMRKFRIIIKVIKIIKRLKVLLDNKFISLKRRISARKRNNRRI